MGALERLPSTLGWLGAMLTSSSGWVLQSPYPPGIAGIGYGVSLGSLWQNNKSFDLSSIVLRWGLAELSQSEALGGGITWALHPSFCDDLLPQFPEKSDLMITFLDCTDLRSATSTAFSTWSMNNPHISFDDVTEACYDHGVGNGTNWTCADAELIIQPSSEQSTSTEAVAWVQYNLSDIEWQPLTTAGARLSIGIGIRQAQMYISTNYCWYFDATFCYHFFRLQEVWGAEMAAFAIRLVSLVTFAMSCLYMALIFYRALRVSAPEARKLTVLAKKKATTKMYLFPAMRRKGAFDKNPGNGGSDDDSIHSESEVGVSSCARVSPPPSPPNDSNDPWSTPVTAASRSNGNRSTKSKKKAGLGWDLQRQSSYGAEPPPPSAEDDLWDGVDQCEALIEYVASMRTGPFFFCSFWLIFLPTFYTRIFLPCWDCHDYEATMAHEIGHVLGFTHPNEKPNLNLRATAPMSTAVCQDPLNHVELAGKLPSTLTTTIMFSITQHLDKTCLTTDDVEGLNFLYPYCDHPAQAPKCIKPRKYSGLLRLGVSVFIPFSGVTVAFFLVMCIVRRSSRIQMITAKRKMTQKLAELTNIQNKLDEAELALIQAEAEKKKLRESHDAEKYALERAVSRARHQNITSRGRITHRASIFARKMRSPSPERAPGEGRRPSLCAVLDSVKRKDNSTPASNTPPPPRTMRRQSRNESPTKRSMLHMHKRKSCVSEKAGGAETAEHSRYLMDKRQSVESEVSQCKSSTRGQQSTRGVLDEIPPKLTTRKSSCARSLMQEERLRSYSVSSSAALPALPEGWSEHETAEGRPYYYCKAAKKSTWIRPVATVPDRHGKAHVHALPEGWNELETNDGEHYYRKKHEHARRLSLSTHRKTRSVDGDSEPRTLRSHPCRSDACTVRLPSPADDSPLKNESRSPLEQEQQAREKQSARQQEQRQDSRSAYKEELRDSPTLEA